MLVAMREGVGFTSIGIRIVVVEPKAASVICAVCHLAVPEADKQKKVCHRCETPLASS